MANHCYNYVTGTGSTQDLTRLQSIVTILKEKEIPIEDFVSCWSQIYPLFFTQLPTQEKEEGGPDVYQDWGSKWFEATFEISPETQEITIYGDSAWGPVLPFFARLCKEYNLELEGSYEEPGMDFAGTFTIDKDGDIIDNQTTYTQHEAQENPEGYWMRLIENIEEGEFETVDEVYARLTEDSFVINEKDKEEIENEFKKYSENQSEQESSE